MANKIAILTQPLGYNYGGIIQNYALQQVLSKEGINVVTINRVYDHPHSELKIAASKAKNLFFRNVLMSKNPKFLGYEQVAKHNIRFMNEHLNLSPEIDSTKKLTHYIANEGFDTVVVGSDQVWRPKYSPNILNFYLNFLKSDTNITKIAYAASFGTDKWEYNREETNICSGLIQKFDGVSVREDSGVKLCSDFLNRKDAINVVDPTLLLNAEDYHILIGDQKMNAGLFTYILDSSLEIDDFINRCAKSLNLKVFSNQVKYKTNTAQSQKIEDYIIPPIEGWLQGFRDADFVITDSFHGSVFSIINRKPFFTIVNKDRGASRFESIFRQLGLEDRLLFETLDFELAKLTQEIDYDSVHLKLTHLKTESLSLIHI